jgi:hypothetical protein
MPWNIWRKTDNILGQSIERGNKDEIYCKQRKTPYGSSAGKQHDRQPQYPAYSG